MDQPRTISTSDAAITSRIRAQSDHASRTRKRSLMALLFAGRRQPQGDVGRLYRLPDHAGQLLLQAVQVSRSAQRDSELFECLGRIVLPAVEAAVDEVLDAVTQRIEQRSDQ